jgi:hypothetical protein
LQGGIVYWLLASPLEAVNWLAHYILDRVCFLAERASNISKCAKDSMLVKSIKCQIDHPLMDGRTLNQQWVLIADSTKALSASFFPDCPIAQPR